MLPGLGGLAGLPRLARLKRRVANVSNSVLSREIKEEHKNWSSSTINNISTYGI